MVRGKIIDDDHITRLDNNNTEEIPYFAPFNYSISMLSCSQISTFAQKQSNL